MDIFSQLFGVENHVSLPQECARAALIFAYGLLLLRVSGRRTFNHWSALDVILSIIVGSALGRAMTGSAPLPGTMAAAAVLTVLHVIIGHLAARHRGAAGLIEGKAVTLAAGGKVDNAACKRNMISQSDLEGALRQKGLNGLQGIDNVKLMALEPSGKISVVKYEPCRSEQR